MPQKGATPDDVARLDRGLRRFAKVVHRDLAVDVADVPGAGAAGGLGAGGMVFLGARQVSGIAVVRDLVGFSEAVANADFVITGEGSMDVQSLYGKAPVGVAAAAATHGVPVAALVGHLSLTQEQVHGAGLCCARALLELEPDVQLPMSRAGPLLARLADELVHAMFQGDG